VVHSAVNITVYNLGNIVNGDYSHSEIADLLGDSTVLLMLGFALVFPTKHLSHLKVPKREQEMAIEIKHLT
jgi:hypothetical protein